MSQNGKWIQPAGLELFNDNQNKIPLDYLLPYIGKHVAWTPDGTRIVASGRDMGDVNGKIVAMGLDPSQVVFDFVDDPNVSYIG